MTVENGSPLTLEPFQRVILRDFFGEARELLVLLPKKSGKTSLMAALATYHVLTVPEAECVIAAASRDQASILYRQATGYIHRSSLLQERLSVKAGYREIRSKADGGRIRVLAADADTADGVLPTLALVDELHRHKSADLYGIFQDGLGPRNGKMVTISTAGDDDASPLGTQRTAAAQLPNVTSPHREWAYRRCASADGAYAMHEWALDEADDRDDISVVKRANPASWQTEEELRRRHDSPSMTPWQWARFACGVWLRGEGAAISPMEWDALERPGLEIPSDQGVYVGLDLGWKIDTTAIVPVWVEDADHRGTADTTILTPPDDGSLLDDRRIVEALLDYHRRYQVKGIVYDPNAGGQQMVQQLERDHGLPFIEHSQDNAPIALADSRLMEAIRRQAIVHDSDPEVREHVLSAVEKPLGGERFRFDRPKRGERRPIDALRALSIAHSVAVAELEAPPKRPSRFLSF